MFVCLSIFISILFIYSFVYCLLISYWHLRYAWNLVNLVIVVFARRQHLRHRFLISFIVFFRFTFVCRLSPISIAISFMYKQYNRVRLRFAGYSSYYLKKFASVCDFFVILFSAWKLLVDAHGLCIWDLCSPRINRKLFDQWRSLRVIKHTPNVEYMDLRVLESTQKTQKPCVVSTVERFYPLQRARNFVVKVFSV